MGQKGRRQLTHFWEMLPGNPSQRGCPGCWSEPFSNDLTTVNNTSSTCLALLLKTAKLVFPSTDMT